MAPDSFRPVLSRRDALKWLGVSAAGAYVAGCGGTAAPTAAPPAPAATSAPAPAAPTSAPAAAAPTVAPTPAPKVTKVTVTMWTETYTPMVQEMEKNQLADFIKKNPNIEYQRSEHADMAKESVTAYGGGVAPDIAQGNGPSTSLQFSGAGWVLPLDEYAKARNWPIYEWARTWNTVKAQWWAMPYGIQTYGLFYNKPVLKKLGIAAPKTYAELTDAMDKVKASGMVPICSDNSGTAPNIRRMLLIYQYALATPKEIEAVVWGDASYDNPAFLEAAKLVADAFKRGWGDAKVGNALNNEQAGSKFAAGQNAFWFSGMYNRKTLVDGKRSFPDFDWGYFHMPSIKAGLPQAVPVGTDMSWYVNAKSKDKIEAILKVLEYRMGLDKDFNKSSLEIAGRLPCMPFDTAGMTIPEDLQYMLDGLKNAKPEQTGMLLHKVWHADLTKYQGQALSGLVLGEVKPEDFVKESAKIWDDIKKKGGQWVPTKK